jgi:hypothetical protein
MGPRDGATTAGERLYPFYRWLNAKIDELRPSVIACMAPIRTPHDTTDRLIKSYGMVAVAGLVVEHRRQLDCPKLQMLTREDQTVVKQFTGRGRWGDTKRKKAAVMDVCRRAYGWDVGRDDDAADALALFWLVERELWPNAAVARGLGRNIAGVSLPASAAPLFGEKP